MRVLLDTHCWLWMQTDPGRFSKRTRELLEDPEHDLLLSVASSWEIAIKYALGKLALPAPPSDYVPSRLQASRTTSLPIQHVHALHVAELPPHHRDPFDRLLIAQAQVEKISVVTVDPEFEPYDVKKIWATGSKPRQSS
jgi:PIN domain nuclease of toxin-antitoxin system